MEVEGIGPERAEAIVEWFSDEANRRARRRAAPARPPPRVRRGGPAARGAADRPDLRDHRHARALVARAGAGGARGARRQGHELRLEEDDGLIVGEEPGASKLTKAQQAGVPLLTEEELAKLLTG